MLAQILNLLPASAVEEIGNASFKSLANRGEVYSWEASYEPEGSIAQKDIATRTDRKANTQNSVVRGK